MDTKSSGNFKQDLFRNPLYQGLEDLRYMEQVHMSLLLDWFPNSSCPSCVSYSSLFSFIFIRRYRQRTILMVSFRGGGAGGDVAVSTA